LDRRKIITSSYLLGGIAVVLIGLYLVLFAPADYRSTRYLFEVRQGLAVADTIDALVENGFLRSSLGGQIAFRLTGINLIRAGTYNVSPRMNAWQVASSIRQGEAAGAKITIPEGFTVEQIYARLEVNQVATSRELAQAANQLDLSKFTFLPGPKVPVRDPLEGFLFPDTYNFDKGMPPAEIINRMINNFQTRTSQLLAEPLPNQLSPLEVITLASLVEKEAKTEADRKLIAGVLFNRIEAGMRLDVDATVRYITSNWTKPITAKDLDSSSPYNTRKFAGLPPGPICNPGLAAISAIISPTASDYLYYLTDGNGVTHYAKTLDEHNQNKAKYLR
jgi:UPF0755 protein